MKIKKNGLSAEELLSLRKMVHAKGGTETLDPDIVWKPVGDLVNQQRSFTTERPGTGGGVRG